MRHVLTLVDGRVIVIAVVLTAAAAVASKVHEQRSGRGWIMLWSLLAFAVVVLMTIANRGVVVSEEGLAHDLTWWTRNWEDIAPLAKGSGFWWHWWLNIALFVPAGLAWTVLTRRPSAVLAASFGVVVLIETLHATVLSGAGDPTDLVANMIGASAGVATASVLASPLRAPGSTRGARRAPGFRLILTALGVDLPPMKCRTTRLERWRDQRRYERLSTVNSTRSL